MNKFKKIIPVLMLLAIPLITIAIPLAAHAQGIIMDQSLRPEFATNIKVAEGSPRAALANAVLQMMAGGLIYLAGPIAVLMLVFGGLRYITSRGDQTQMDDAKKTITWSVIGLVVIILSWAIITNIMWIATSGGTLGTDSEAGKLPTTTPPAQEPAPPQMPADSTETPLGEQVGPPPP